MKQLFDSVGTPINLLQDNDIEYGSNYIKFSNGVLIVFGHLQLKGEFIQANTHYRFTAYDVFTFPIRFSTLPEIFINPCSDKDFAYFSVLGTERSFDRITKVQFIRDIAISNADIQASVLAIGRWK